ncbi:MAG TPA: phytanoyl-CoA dioxygenase family protein [Candidatus Limnocylindria bacterium]
MLAITRRRPPQRRHVSIYESKAVSIPMKAGEFIMFWSTLMHASHPHLGKTRNMRMAFAARYVPTSVRIYPDTDVVTEYGGTISLAKYGAVLVCGRDEFGHNRIAERTLLGKAFKRRQRTGDRNRVSSE